MNVVWKQSCVFQPGQYERQGYTQRSAGITRMSVFREITELTSKMLVLSIPTQRIANYLSYTST